MPDIGALLVEDERLLDRVMTDALRAIGLACEAADNAEDAIQRLETHSYDLMILDLRLQQGSGVTVLEQARQLFPDLPVIVITAYTINEDLQRALALGIDALLYKPFDIETLLATVGSLLHYRRTPHSTHAVVQMDTHSAPQASWRIDGLGLGAFAALKQNALALACRVRQMDEGWLSVETERVAPPDNPRWLLEWTGNDALYQCSTRVVEYLSRENSAFWLLRQPTLIRRLQRRRYPRVKVSGRAFVSLTGRLQRATEATLLDLSEQGVCVVLSEPPHRSAQVHVEAQAETEIGTLRFQREGVVRNVVAFVAQGQPHYRVGLQLERLPKSLVSQLRQLRVARLTEMPGKPTEDSSRHSE